MAEALIRLAKIFVPPYVRVKDGNIEHVDGYWREAGEAVRSLTERTALAEVSGKMQSAGFVPTKSGNGYYHPDTEVYMKPSSSEPDTWSVGVRGGEYSHLKSTNAAATAAVKLHASQKAQPKVSAIETLKTKIEPKKPEVEKSDLPMPTTLAETVTLTDQRKKTPAPPLEIDAEGLEQAMQAAGVLKEPGLQIDLRLWDQNDEGTDQGITERTGPHSYKVVVKVAPKPGYEDRHLYVMNNSLIHEMRHVRQNQDDPQMLAKYQHEWHTVGYGNISYEIEARLYGRLADHTGKKDTGDLGAAKGKAVWGIRPKVEAEVVNQNRSMFKTLQAKADAKAVSTFTDLDEVGIGDVFIYRGKRYTRSGYAGTIGSDANGEYETVQVFKDGGGVTFIKVRGPKVKSDPMNRNQVGLAVPPAGTRFTDESAAALVKEIADLMESKGLFPYVSPGLTDARLGGLATADNSQNWQIHDGDGGTSNQFLLTKIGEGQAEVGVGVWGGPGKADLYYPYSGAMWDEDHERFDVDEVKVRRYGEKIAAALRAAGLDVVEVRLSGNDAGFGTLDVGYSVVFNKPGRVR